MKVFQIVYDCIESDSKEVIRETSYWTGCWKSVTEAAVRHSEEYEKELVSISEVLTVTRQFDEGDRYYTVDDE